MSDRPYGLFCPTSKATEVLNPRWTIQILGELWDGSTRFNEIRRGLPGISPTLLAKRLKEMQENGLVERVEDPASGAIDYIRTKKAEELDPILQGLARWAQRHITAEIALEDRDADVLMWTVHRRINQAALPKRRIVMRFNFTDATSPARTYWLMIKPDAPVELCVRSGVRGGSVRGNIGAGADGHLLGAAVCRAGDYGGPAFSERRCAAGAHIRALAADQHLCRCGRIADGRVIFVARCENGLRPSPLFRYFPKYGK